MNSRAIPRKGIHKWDFRCSEEFTFFGLVTDREKERSKEIGGGKDFKPWNKDK